MIFINKLKATGFTNIKTESFCLPEAEKRGIRLSVLRLDLLHPVVSGNKWFKLRFYIEAAERNNKSTIISFGGAWSNHIVATAAYCAEKGLQSMGIIRGESPAVYSSSLKDAEQYGMKLFFTSREEYRKKIIPADILSQIDPGLALIIPEGGYGTDGASGAATITDHLEDNNYTHIFCACGTGTTLAGLISASEAHCTGISVLKNHTGLENDIKNILPAEGTDKKFEIIHDYHFGGYAKKTQELTGFMNSFYESTGIPTDFVYTGKLFYAVSDLIKKDHLPGNSRVLVIHSGGLQGNRSLEKGTLIF